ncbi:MAG: hypothetical protein RL386_1156 [Bacteroidota bacterium]|jgi:hypothetical protein
MQNVKMVLLLAMLGALVCSTGTNPVLAQKTDKFKQLYEILPTPSPIRTGAGAPGNGYWQQKADYVINLRLDDLTQRIYGEETVHYTNYSPDVLEYLWLQLDQNQKAKDSDSYKIATGTMNNQMSLRDLQALQPAFDGGFKLEFVRGVEGNNLQYVVVKTMMRIDPPTPLKPGDTFSFKIKWSYNINDRIKLGGRSGYEYFPEDGNYLYAIAQFFPRMCVYDDIEGWQNKQFLGKGEFTLPFGDYDVSITVPADHIVAATGLLQNPKEVLSREQISRLDQAQKERSTPVFIVTPDEARSAEKKSATNEKTWKFKAQNVRDFAFASSRKFIWDALGVPMSNGQIVLAMSAYPKEGNPLWEQYSTKVVAHTLKWYSNYTFDYPYPVAWSVHTNNIGMEYPMVSFNGGRPEKDGTYTQRVKYGMIGVIIHEVGHNYFPMIVNSDERQWTWMDEGLNSFVQYLTEQQWERNYPHRRGPSNLITDYMKLDKKLLEPIMSNSESVSNLGANAYSKPTAALNILRETILGRDLFDSAFKIYANRWKFKHPAPADFFRTMEDASGIDLDWFWNGWFYTTDHVDIAIENVKAFRLDTKNPEVENAPAQTASNPEPRAIGTIRNEKAIKITQDEIDPSLKDFYSYFNTLNISALDLEDYKKYLSSLSPEEAKFLESPKFFYEITFKNKGGLVMPLILKFEYTDGNTEELRIPAEIWLLDNEAVSKLFMTNKAINRITLDPYLETADTDMSNNYFPPVPQMNRFELFREKMTPQATENPMQRAKRANALEKK